MPSKERNQKIDAFLDKAGELVDEVVATFKDPKLAEARWEESRKSRKQH